MYATVTLTNSGGFLNLKKKNRKTIEAAKVQKSTWRIFALSERIFNVCCHC